MMLMMINCFCRMVGRFPGRAIARGFGHHKLGFNLSKTEFRLYSGMKSCNSDSHHHNTVADMKNYTK